MKKIYYLCFALIFTVSSASFAQGIFSIFAPSASEKSKKKLRVKFVEGDEEAKEEILLIKIKGVIQEKDEEQSIPFQPNKDMFKQIKKDLLVAEKRDAIKAVLIEINSPGGEVTASDIIYHQIENFKKKTGKPVVAHFGTLGASGAYYVACAADKILAHPTSILGSIGVIMHGMNFERLVANLGIKPVVLKSEKTPKKDILSPFREMTVEEKEMILEIINSIYERFVEIVTKGRKMTRKDVEKIADGGIYNATRAKELGLIDQIGYREDSMAVACKLAKIESAALVKSYSKKGFAEVLSEMASMNSGAPALINEFKKIMESSEVPSLMYKMSMPLSN